MEGGREQVKLRLQERLFEKYKNLRGVYLCWNNLLASKIKHDLEIANIKNCQVEQYIAFLSKTVLGERFP